MTKPAESHGEVLLYRAASGQPTVEVVMDRETVWLSLNQIAELFGRNKSVISRHLANIYETRELSRKATVAKNATVQQQEAGRKVRRMIEYYSLDAILAVGYRVNFKRGTQFRIWATKTLKEHQTSGYVLNQQRFEENSREPEAALRLIHKTASRNALTANKRHNPSLKGVLTKDYGLDKQRLGQLINLVSGIAVGAPTDRVKYIHGDREAINASRSSIFLHS